MTTQVPIPKLGQSEETVSIVKWHKQEGELVAKGDILFEVETDKAVLEVESQFEGTLLKITIPEGREVPVMSIAAVIGEPGEEVPKIEVPAPPPQAAPSPSPTASQPAVNQPAAKTTPAEKPVEPAAPSVDPIPAATPATPVAADAKAGQPRHRVSPRARKTAGEYLIDLHEVGGSGPGGRVVERDLDAYLESIRHDRIMITPAARNLAKKLKLPITKLKATGSTGRITIEDVRQAEMEQPRPMTKVRQVIAKRLQQSKQNIPHFYVTVGVDVTELVSYRYFLKKEGYPVSINDFILKSSALALRDFPQVNSVTTDGTTIQQRANINIGMAVNAESGLVVPVVPNADLMSLDELHATAQNLANKARDQKLSPEEMQGGTFTVSNMGMMKVDNFSAIINPGESAILAVSSVLPTPAVMENRTITVRDIMKITISADHRVVDGVLAARFVNQVKKKLEDIRLWQTATGIAWNNHNQKEE